MDGWMWEGLWIWIDWAESSKESTLMLTLDAEKAFDRLWWEFIFDTCTAFGFHESFINVFRAMYKNPQAAVKVNGALSRTFNLKAGGLPLTFDFCFVLAESIRQNRKITGIKVGGYKLALYDDDDVMVTKTNVENSLESLMDEIHIYSGYSGYAHKTEAMDGWRKVYASRANTTLNGVVNI